jgi:hypothetical protein
MLLRALVRLAVRGSIHAIKAHDAKVSRDRAAAPERFPELASVRQLLLRGNADASEIRCKSVIAAVSRTPAALDPGSRTRSLVGRATALLAEGREMQGRYRLARKTWARALDLLDAPSDEVAWRGARARLLLAETRVKDLVGEVPLLQGTLTRWRERANEHASRGDSRGAETLLLRALGVAQEELGPEHAKTALLRRELAEVVEKPGADVRSSVLVE